MKIFEVVEDTDTVYATRSESLAYERAVRCKKQPVWIVEMLLDTDPHVETVWDHLREFRKEYCV